MLVVRILQSGEMWYLTAIIRILQTLSGDKQKTKQKKQMLIKYVSALLPILLICWLGHLQQILARKYVINIEGREIKSETQEKNVNINHANLLICHQRQRYQRFVRENI